MALRRSSGLAGQESVGPEPQDALEPPQHRRAGVGHLATLDLSHVRLTDPSSGAELRLG